MWLLLLLVVKEATASGCPRKCECKWSSGKKSVLCLNAGFTTIPPDLDPTTQWLDLFENRLPILRDQAFSSAGLLNLQRLRLAACNVRSIRPDAFHALVNLMELDLSSNRLITVPSTAFFSIRELRVLHLDGNSITKIEEDAFSALTHLVRLTLSACKILEIEYRAFNALSSLENLNLRMNRIKVLHVEAMAPLRSLKGLDLAGNPWECTCALRPLRDWMIRNNVPMTAVPECALPMRLSKHSWNRIDLEDFACLPEVRAVPQEIKGLEKEEITLICQVNGVPAPRVLWMRAGRLIANTSGKIFTIHDEANTNYLIIKSADLQDSGSYMCNAENRAGKTEVVLSLTVDKKTKNNGYALLAGIVVTAVLVLSVCLIGLCVYGTRKKRQLDRWNQQIVTFNARDDSYENTENTVNVTEENRVLPSEGRKRDNYKNVPSNDPEDEYERSSREMSRESAVANQPGPAGRSIQFEPPRHLVARDADIRIRSKAGTDSIKNSSGILGTHAEILSENIRFHTNFCSFMQPLAPSRHDRHDRSGSDSEKNLIEMNDLGTHLGSEKNDPYCSYTNPQRKYTDSRSPLLGSRRNSSGGSSGTSFDRPYKKSRQTSTGDQSNSFLDISVCGNHMTRNLSLPTSPSRGHPIVPLAIPLLDLSGLRDYSRKDPSLDDNDFRASQLEKFLEECRSLEDKLSRMKETRENLQGSRVVESVEMHSVMKGKPRLDVTETSSSVAMADTASPLVLGPPDYHPQQPRPEGLNTLLFRN